MATDQTWLSRHATAESADDRLLRWAVLFFAAAVLVHNSDHARRGGDTVGADVFVVGSAAILLEVAVVVVVLQRHRIAPLVAMTTGFSLAAGYVLVHTLPPRGWLSDALFSGGASWLSQSAATLEIVAALGLGTAGMMVLRRRGGLASAVRDHPGARPLGSALREPAVIAMALGNAALFAITVATL